jgi:ribose 5-phosphate isomerase B
LHTRDAATRLVARFVTTPFSGDERHARRIAMIGGYEESGDLPELPGPPALA